MAAGDLTTLAAVQAYLGDSSAAAEPVLESLITAMSAWLVGEVGHAITSGSGTVTLDGTGRSWILLPSYPVSSVTSVAVDGETIPARATVTGNGWVLADSSIGKLALVGYEFTRGVQNVSVAYAIGASSVPADVAHAVNELVGLKFRERTRLGQASANEAGVSVSFLPALVPAWIKALIERLQRQGVG